MKNIDSINHVMGKSVYVDDVPELENTLFALIVTSPIVHGILHSIELKTINNDFVSLIKADHIPGENQIGTILPDEELLVSKDIHYMGQPLAIIIAKTLTAAYDIRKEIKIQYTEKEGITDPRIAFEKGSLINPPRILSMGDVDNAWDQCDLIVENRVEIGGQEHLYLETQGAYCIPNENGFQIISSTQGPTLVQKTVSKVLGVSMHKIEVDVRRLGGAFGGKEDQATTFACLTALSSYVTNKPVKLILDRIDDMKITGKRHPYSADYKIGLKGKKIYAYEVIFYQNAGSSADLSPAVLGRTLTHATNSYFVPNVRATGISCKTNLPPNTAFRGFGGPQGMFVIEVALHRCALELGIDTHELQGINLLSDGDEFLYGQKVENSTINKSWNKLRSKVKKDINNVKEFNKKNSFRKMGYAFMPITFGISFNNIMMNQASSLVNIYLDGSVGVSTGAVEMGQGVNTRILQVVQSKFSIPANSIKIETTNTTRVINTSPSAASSTHDLNGKATENACEILLKRLVILAADILKADIDDIVLSNGIFHTEENRISWNDLISEAFSRRTDLAAHGYYITPKINFDNITQKGHPFAYHTFGAAFITTTLDCIRGTYELEKVEIVHDSGKSMNTYLDLGQIEGALVQGLGWMLLEDLVFENGRLVSNALSTYKIPDINFVPKEINTEFLEENNPLGLMGSKGVGEPPLMYGIAGFFAVKDAMNSFKETTNSVYQSPLTHERVLLELYSDDTQ